MSSSFRKPAKLVTIVLAAGCVLGITAGPALASTPGERDIPRHTVLHREMVLPLKPAKNVKVTTSGNTIKVTWNRVDRATDYKVQIASDANFKYSGTIDVKTATVGYFTKNLNLAKYRYYIRVIADAPKVAPSYSAVFAVGKAAPVVTPTPKPTQTTTPKPPVVTPTPTATPKPPVVTPTPTPTNTPAPAPIATQALPATTTGLGNFIYTFRNFTADNNTSGAHINGAIKGAGSAKTVVEMVPGTSTRASSVHQPINNNGGLANPTNQLYLLRGITDIEGVTLKGTEQGHLYNGIYVTGANPTIKDVVIDSVPGNSSANPGETFAIGANRVSGTATVQGLTLKGGSGSLKSAAGLGINNDTATWNINGLTSQGLAYSAPVALWQASGTYNIHNFVQKGGPRALGAERVSGTVNLYDPQWDAPTSGHDVTYTWESTFTNGKINFYFSSASKVPNRKIVVLTNKVAGITGSVNVYINGVKQNTADYIKFI